MEPLAATELVQEALALIEDAMEEGGAPVVDTDSMQEVLYCHHNALFSCLFFLFSKKMLWRKVVLL